MATQRHATRHHTNNMIRWHSNGYDTIDLTLANASGKILANKENYELGDRQRNHLCTGMDTTGKDKAERNALFVRRQMGWRSAENHMALHLRDIEGGTNNRAANTSSTQQTTDDKKKASVELADKTDDPPIKVGTRLLRGP